MRDRLYKNIASLEDRGHIRLATSSQWGMTMISDAILWFKEAFPKVTFEFRHLDVDLLFRLLDDHKLDFALAALSSDKGLRQTTKILRKEELFFAVPASHPYCSENAGDQIRRRLVQRGPLPSPTSCRAPPDRIFSQATAAPSLPRASSWARGRST